MLIEQTCKLFPQIRDHIDFKDIGSPVTNKYYLAQPNGEIYGLDHTLERFDPLMAAKLRPKTDIPGMNSSAPIFDPRTKMKKCSDKLHG